MESLIAEIKVFDPEFDITSYLRKELTRVRMINGLMKSPLYYMWELLSKYTFYIENDEKVLYLEIQNPEVVPEDILHIEKFFPKIKKLGFESEEYSLELDLLYKYLWECNLYFGRGQNSIPMDHISHNLDN